MMLVSVVMPVFNGADVLHEQLVALASQSFDGPWELIVADNGSTDTSRQVIEGFSADLPIEFVDASARSGNAAARNLGVAAASGDVLLFCDQDDAVGPLWISSHVEYLSETDISVGPYEMRTDMSDAETGLYAAAPTLGAFGFLPYGLSANMGMQRRAFDMLGGFDETYPAACDVDICWRAQLQGLALLGVDEAIVIKRKRVAAGGVWRQHYTFGQDDVRLYRRFRSEGMPRRVILAAKTYGWLLVHVPHLLDHGFRIHWIGVAGQRMGRIAGSLSKRQFFP